jgi:hypothetical protein
VLVVTEATVGKHSRNVFEKLDLPVTTAGCWPS